ncbi:MAG: hypothetical protein AB7Q17_08200 [Phycisphaerae bacterium]
MLRLLQPGACALLLTCGGCGLLLDVVNPPITTVRLVNNSDFDVRVVLFYDDEQDAPRDLLTEFGVRMELTLAPGETASFTRDCTELQALVIDNAELRIIGQVGPEADTEVLRDGREFDCRDVITFTFDHSPLLVDFDVGVAVASGS